MEYKVEKFWMSPSCTASIPPRVDTQKQTYKSSRPTGTALRKRSSQLELLSTQQLKENRRSNVALNLCPDGSEINININGTNLTATKTSLNVSIGNFIINIKPQNDCTLIKEYIPAPPSPSSSSVVGLVSVTQRNPLHVALAEDSACVKATLSLSKLNCKTILHDNCSLWFSLYVQLSCFLNQMLILLT